MLAYQMSNVTSIESCSTIKVLSLFSGIGAFEKAFFKLGIPFKLVNYCEIDKYASKVYSFIHGIDETLNLGDISKVDPTCLKDFDLVTYGFPCQDISIAGDGAGIKEGTRSGLLYYALDIIKAKKPLYAIAENVKNLVGKRHRDDFEKLLFELDELGYNNYWKVLNSKCFGVPQSRERVFIVSIRKDIDQGFTFPNEYFNDLVLSDILESNVDNSYFIDDKRSEALLKELNTIDTRSDNNDATDYDNIKIFPCITPDRVNKRQNGRRFKEENAPMFTLTSQDRHGILQVGKLDMKGYDCEKRVFDITGISPTLTTSKPPKLAISNMTNPKGKLIQFSKESKDLINNDQQYKIRKLTPLEAWKLMGFSELDFYKAKYILNKTFYNERDRSNSQLYKMAGNSIVVNVLVELFKNLFNNHINAKANYYKRLNLLKSYYGITDSKEMFVRLTNERFTEIDKEYPTYFRKAS